LLRANRSNSQSALWARSQAASVWMGMTMIFASCGLGQSPRLRSVSGLGAA
jgi:hypothetical protein